VQRPAAAAAAHESEWDAAASQVLATINRAGTLATLAGQYGLPDVNCLTALYKAIELPAKAKGKGKSIAFNAFGANYDSREQKLTITKPAANNKSYAQTGTGAAVCAEHYMWAAVGPKVKGATYIGIGQSVCPCKLCMARYSALASIYNADIMVCWEQPYDSQPANSCLIFPKTAAATAYGPA
jgi:hypothetical protein